ncbi:MAG: DUF4350 domain-containing protein [Pyrinomonadaceae bacterium]
MPSRYAARFTLVAINNADTESAEPVPATEPEEKEESPPSTAPVAHFSDDQGALLIDHAYGDGRVMLLSDPFILANNGIEREDNLQLALNMLGGRDNLIAFDEYHHGALERRAKL